MNSKPLAKEAPRKGKIAKKTPRKTSFCRFRFIQNEDEVLDEGGPMFDSRKTVVKGVQLRWKEDLENNSETDEDDWNIAQLVIGDGTQTDFRTLQKGKLYASGGPHGDLNSFFPVEEESLGLHYIKGRSVCVKGRYITEKGISAHGSSAIIVRLDMNILRSDGSTGFTDECLRHLKLHPGHSMNINFPGRRRRCERSRRFWKMDETGLFMSGSNHNCLVASAVNIVHAMIMWKTCSLKSAIEAAERAKRVFAGNCDLTLYTVASLKPLFHRMKLGFDVKKFDTRTYQFEPFLSITEPRFFIVRLSGRRKLDHVIGVDLARKCLLDNYESYPMYPSEQGFKIATGGTPRSRIIEVREIVFTRKELLSFDN
ncbi:hypothetical protein FGB62_339g02 [Gracilaria domingensis]|nr:hypothetical protein FGB62_339g02 [Gracilaria domingensis]